MKAKFKEKVCYCIAAMGYEIEAGVVISYMLLFGTDVMNLSPGLLGGLVFGTKILDAVSDIIITNIADKTQTRFGKYRPWILIGIPLAVCFLLFFSGPSIVTGSFSRIFWFCSLYILMVPVCETSYMCPAWVMGTVMSPDPNDRLDFATARSLGENIADLVTNASCMTIILLFGSYRNVRGWQIMGIIFAVCIALCSIIGFSGTRERVTPDNTNKKGEVLTFREKIITLFKGNIDYIKLIFIQFGMHIAWTTNLNLFNYFCINNAGHPEWVSTLATLGTLAQMCGTFLVSILARRMEFRDTTNLGCLFLVFGGIALFYANSFGTILLYQLLKGLGLGLIFVSTFSSLPIMSDYIEWKTGIAIPGMVMAVMTFFMKINVAIGSFCSTEILNLGGYNSALTVQSDSTLTWIRLGMVFFLTGGAVIVFAANHGLHVLTREKAQMYAEENELQRKGLSAD